MYKSNDWLDAVKSHYGLHSDYGLAKKLGVSCQRISNYRANRSAINEELAFKVAEALEIDPGEVMLTVMAERTKDAHFAKSYENILKKIGSMAAAVLLAVTMSYGIFAPSPAVADGVEQYILC